MQLAFARIKENWDDAVFISVHSRPLKGLAEVVRSNCKVGILTDNVNSPSEIARELLARGIENCKVFVCQDLGSEEEKIVETDLVQAADKSFSDLNVMIIVRLDRELTQESWQLLGIADERFAIRSQQKSLITKLEIRAVSLAKLGLRENSIVWDIGAGSGAVSIEASLLAGKGQVFAIEKNGGDVVVIQENVKRFNRTNIEIIQASAPEGLEGLHDPSAIFIGGSGGRLPAILRLACQKLKAGGRIVVNLATLENLQAACRELEVNGFDAEITLINIARSKAVLELTRLEALNPVFVVAGWRKNEGVPKSE
jgi:precorrin-6Y C5,15-methyltransferase (decarboxylating)